MGFLSNIFGSSNKKTAKDYAEEFKSLWENEQISDAKNCIEKWTKQYPNDRNCKFAIVMLNVRLGSVPYHMAYDLFNKLAKYPSDSNFDDWFYINAKRELEMEASARFSSSNLGVKNVFRV